MLLSQPTVSFRSVGFSVRTASFFGLRCPFSDETVPALTAAKSYFVNVPLINREDPA
jgi:hypothetical protein